MGKQFSSKKKRFPRWFLRKEKRANLYEISDSGEEDGDEYINSAASGSPEMDPCTVGDELRIFVGTWNVAGRSPVGSLAVDLDEWLNLKDAVDMYVLGYQEIVPLKPATVIGVEDQTEAINWNDLIGKTINEKYRCPWLTPIVHPITNEDYKDSSEIQLNDSSKADSPAKDVSRIRVEQKAQYRYKLIASKKMVGVFISVWMRREMLERYNISGVKVSSVACGIMGYLGNKGSVSVSMSIEGTSFCFIAAHLASGEKKGDEGRRNHQVSEIFRRTSFRRLRMDENDFLPLTILGHDRIFWFGDLNYRLFLEDNLARQLIKEEDWRALQRYDQLRTELEEGGVFQSWEEGNIEFAPTYKYSSYNCNRYSGAIPIRAGEKQRTPAWCDRILWYGKGIRQLSYFRSEIKFSDHRPVSALFSTWIEVGKCDKHKSHAAPDTSFVGTGKTQRDKTTREGQTSTLQSLINKDTESSPTNIHTYIADR